MSNTRNKLLNLSKKMIQSRIVDIADPDGSVIKVEVRSPTIAQSAMFAEAGRSADQKAQIRVMAQIVIQCCHDPESGGPVFGPADEDLILECPTNGWVQPLVTAVTDMLSAAETSAKN